MTKLHAAISSHHLYEAINLLKAPAVDVNDIDENGFSALQLAAREGHTHIVLLLLQFGVRVDGMASQNKPALSFAVEYGHLHVAAVLVAYGANKQLAIDNLTEEVAANQTIIENLEIGKNILISIIVFIIKRKSTFNLQKFLLQLQTDFSEEDLTPVFQGFTELALQTKQMQTANIILEFNKTPRQDFHILNAGFWAAKMNACIVDVFCPTENDRALTLWQLNKFDLGLFSTCLKKESKSVKALLKKIRSPAQEEDVITQAAMKHDIQTLEAFCENSEESFDALTQAYQQSHFVAIDALLSVVKFSLQKGELTQFSIINYCEDLFPVVLDQVDVYAIESSLTDVLQMWNKYGFMYVLISRGIQYRTQPTEKMLSVMKKLQDFGQNRLSPTWLLERCLFNSFGIDINNVTGNISKTATCFKRFGFDFSPGTHHGISRLQLLGNDIVQLIFSFLHSKEDFSTLRHVSLWVSDMASTTKVNSLALENERKLLLEKKIKILTDFIDLLEEDDQRIFIFKIILGVILIGGLTTSAVLLFWHVIPIMKQTDDILDHLFNDKINNTTCGDISGSHRNPCNNLSKAIKFCKDLCDQLPDQGAETGFLVGAVVSAIISAVCFIAAFNPYLYINEFYAGSKKAKRMARIGFGTEEKPELFSGLSQFSNLKCAPITKIVIKTKEELVVLEEELKKLINKAAVTIEVKEIASDEKQEASQPLTSSPTERYDHLHGLWKRTPSSYEEGVVPLLKVEEDEEEDLQFGLD